MNRHNATQEVCRLQFSHPIRSQTYDPITRELIVETDSVREGEELEIDLRVCDMSICLIVCAYIKSIANISTTLL